MNQIKVRKDNAKGVYFVAGVVQDILSGYTVTKSNKNWMIDRVYGKGPIFNEAFFTKREALEAIRKA